MREKRGDRDKIYNDIENLISILEYLKNQNYIKKIKSNCALHEI